MALLQITEPGQAIDPHMRKRAAGIDLGTTNSLIASLACCPDSAGDGMLDCMELVVASNLFDRAAARVLKNDEAFDQGEQTRVLKDPVNQRLQLQRSFSCDL